MYQKKSQAILRVIIIIGILILLNIILDSVYFRLDFTEDKRYTLSDATKEILANLEEPVTITAYFSKELTPDYQKSRDDFEDLLREYESYSDNKVVYKFVDPDDDENLKQSLARKGINPFPLQAASENKFELVTAYMGVTIQQGEKSEVIPALQPQAPMEYALTFAIKKTSNIVKPGIALVSGHGEATRQKLQQALTLLEVLYQVDVFNMTDTTPIPEKYSTIAIINPRDSFTFNELRQLDQFLGRGGNILIAHGLVRGNLQQGMGNVQPTLLESWLESKGISIKRNLVYDINCAEVTVQQRQNNYIINTPVAFPYIPIITNFGKHPVTKGLETIILPFASEINYNTLDTTIRATNLMMTSEKSGAENAPLYFNVMRNWVESEFERSKIPVAVAFEGPFVGNATSRMILVTNGEFALNDERGRIQGSPDNVNFLASAIDWLTDESGLAELRTKSVTSRPIKEIEDKKKPLIKYANVLSPILLILIIGVVRAQMQKRKRRNWQEDKI